MTKTLATILSLVCSCAFGTETFYDMVTTPAELGTNSSGTFYTMIDGEVSAGWAKRIKITIDSSVVDAPLTNFPVMVKISTASGIGDTNLIAVFNEISTNSLKLAVTASDGTTELYVEIEQWDFSTTNAVIWFKAPLIASGSDTDFYLNYDNDHSDNSTYVGLAQSAAAVNVWRSEFAAVWHLSETGTIDRLDSTANGNDAVTQNYNGYEATTGKIDGADDLDGVNDYLSAPYTASLELSDGSFSISYWVESDSDTARQAILSSGVPADAGANYGFDSTYAGHIANDPLYIFLNGDGASGVLSEYFNTGGIADGNPRYFTFVINRTTDLAAVYNSGVQIGAATDITGLGSISNGLPTLIGEVTTKGRYFNGFVDEVRIIKEALTDAEIKANYNSGFDSFVTYGAEETP